MVWYWGNIYWSKSFQPNCNYLAVSVHLYSTKVPALEWRKRVKICGIVIAHGKVSRVTKGGVAADVNPYLFGGVFAEPSQRGGRF